MPTIQEELDLVYEKHPDFAGRVITAIEAGEINPTDYSKCFYGHVCKNDGRAARRLDQLICEALGINYFSGTPIEELLYASYKQTHKTCPELATLHTSLQPYLQQERLV